MVAFDAGVGVPGAAAPTAVEDLHEADATLHQSARGQAESAEGARDILVNAIAPGWIDTRMNAVDSEDVRRQTSRQTPLRRWGRPEEIAATVVFLATTANFMTGQVLVTDGGLGNVYSAL